MIFLQKGCLQSQLNWPRGHPFFCVHEGGIHQSCCAGLFIGAVLLVRKA